VARRKIYESTRSRIRATSSALKKPIIAVALLVAALLLFLWLKPEHAPQTAVDAPAVPAASAAPPELRPAIAGATPSPSPPKEPARVRLPRPTAAAAPAPAAIPGASDPAARPIKISELAGKLKDRRGANAPADADFELELIHAGLDTVTEDIEACLAEWSDAGGLLDGEVLIGFQLDESGLTESWVQDDAELPFGVKSCFGNAVYGVDWSHVVKKPAEVTQKFAVSKAPL